MAQTLTQVENMVHLALDDAAADRWSDADVELWIVEAIRHYSLAFPRTRNQTIDCTAGTQAYDLPADCIGILLVEYPKGEDPPEYLNRHTRRSSAFANDDGYYDIEVSDEGGGTLYISADDAVATEDIELTYRAYHDTTIESGDDVTVPEPHIPILVAFVVWKALQQMLATEEQAPDTTIHLIGNMRDAADSARAAWRQLLDDAKAAASASKMTPAWRMDDFDPIY